MIRVEDLRVREKVIYYKKNWHYGVYAGMSFKFYYQVDSILKTKVKMSCGREFKIEKGVIPDLYPLSEYRRLINTILDTYLEEFEEEMSGYNKLKKVALLRLVQKWGVEDVQR